jgi:hypothetical protein
MLSSKGSWGACTPHDFSVFLYCAFTAHGLPYLLSTPLGIPEEVSRVRLVGLRRDGLGGVLLTVLPTLCGSPDSAEGRAG